MAVGGWEKHGPPREEPGGAGECLWLAWSSSFQKQHLEVECRGLKGSRGCSQCVENRGGPERRVPCLRLCSTLGPRTDPGLLDAGSCSTKGAVVLGGVARATALGLGPRESGGTERSRNQPSGDGV